MSEELKKLLQEVHEEITIFDFESSTLSRIDVALNPEKMTVCIAPILAHASIAIGNSGTIV